MLAWGIASSQWVTVSTTVSRWVKPLEGGCGPTRFTFTWSERSRGPLYSYSRARWWILTLACWQAIHDLAHSPTCRPRPCQTYLWASSLPVACTPGGSGHGHRQHVSYAWRSDDSWKIRILHFYSCVYAYAYLCVCVCMCIFICNFMGTCLFLCMCGVVYVCFHTIIAN